MFELSNLQMVESQCLWILELGFLPSVITHFIQTFHPFVTDSNKSEWNHMAGRSATTILIIVQITLRSVSLCLSFSEINCVNALWNEWDSLSITYCMLPRSACTSSKINFCVLWVYFIFLVLVFQKLFKINRHVTLKMSWYVYSSFVGLNHEHRASTMLDINYLKKTPALSFFGLKNLHCKPKCLTPDPTVTWNLTALTTTRKYKVD
jgi:hypothetical protein